MFLLQKDLMVKDVRLVYVYTEKQWSGIQKHILWECPLKNINTKANSGGLCKNIMFIIRI